MKDKVLKLGVWFLLSFLLMAATGIATGQAHGAEAKKCLIVAAYHDGFPGQTLKVGGARSALEGKCEIKQFSMDTKRNPSPAFARQKALEAKALVESWNPDILIAIDDNVSKYLVQPYFREAELPVVFSGVDWTVEEYGYPYANVTGMIETYPVPELIQQINRILPEAKSSVCIRGERLSEKKDCARYNDYFGRQGIEVFDRPVVDFDEFEKAFREAQKADFVIFQNYSGIAGWDDARARAFVKAHARKLVVSQLEWMADFSMLAITQSVEEQGEYAAQVALKILEGAKPADFPIIANRRWNLYVNEPLLEKAGIELPLDLLHKAEKVVSGPRCLFVASYHPGNAWQDGVEAGLRPVLEGECEIRRFDMDTKRNPSDDFCRRKGLEAKALIEAWKPDVVIAADDNASRCLVAPHFRDAELPFVFCGVNWTAEEYGYPYANATGMIEILPIRPLLSMIKEILPRARRGVVLLPDRFSEHKSARRHREFLGQHDIELETRITDGMESFEKEYIAAQEADFIILINNSVIDDWDAPRAEKVVHDHAGKLVVTLNRWMSPFTMLSVTHVPEEQGRYAGETALRILGGARPADIPVIANRKWNAVVNRKLLKKAGIELPQSILQQVEIRE